MIRLLQGGCLIALLTFFVTMPAAIHAQFSGNVQGTVADSTGAVLPGAELTLTNTDTGVKQTTQANAEGIFRFLSLAPGPYDLETRSSGFTTHKVHFQLQTAQTLNLPVTLNVSAQTMSVNVTDQAPVIDTAESRTQLTIDKAELDSLPLPGHDLLGLTTIAPGVTGLGVIGSGGNGQSNDNYAAETQVTASANGRSSVGNAFIVDGLDITSDITPGVLNLVPNPDSIQEATVQVNTYTVDYGRASSIVEVLTTRSGTSNYHFVGNEYYTANWLTARTEFQPKETTTMQPFHTNNLSATLGGPVPLLKQMFFFTGWEPLLALTQSPSTVTYEDPAFTAWAATQWPNSTGVKLLKQYPATNVNTSSVSKQGNRISKHLQ
jgi:hypothetical protein